MCAVLIADSIRKAYQEKDILLDVYFRCETGDIIALFGRNGSGKSTLLQILFGSLPADRSFIQIDGQEVGDKAFKQRMIAYLAQDNFLPAGLTVSSLVSLCIPKEKRKQFLGDRFIYKTRHSHIWELSEGELRYLEIKIVLNNKAPFLLLDEPFNGLSPAAAEEIRSQINDAAASHAIVISDHNYREVHQIANRFFYLQDCLLKEIKDIRELATYGYYTKEI